MGLLQTLETAARSGATIPELKRLEMTNEPSILTYAAEKLIDANGDDVGGTRGKLLYGAADADAVGALLGTIQVSSGASFDLEGSVDTAIYTPPAGYQFFLTSAILVYRTVDTVTTQATTKLTNGTADITQDLATGTSPTANSYTAYALETSGVVLCDASNPLTFESTGGAATAFLGTVHAFGYLIATPA